MAPNFSSGHGARVMRWTPTSGSVGVCSGFSLSLYPQQLPSKINFLVVSKRRIRWGVRRDTERSAITKSDSREPGWQVPPSGQAPSGSPGTVSEAAPVRPRRWPDADCALTPPRQAAHPSHVFWGRQVIRSSGPRGWVFTRLLPQLPNTITGLSCPQHLRAASPLCNSGHSAGLGLLPTGRKATTRSGHQTLPRRGTPRSDCLPGSVPTEGKESTALSSSLRVKRQDRKALHQGLKWAHAGRRNPDLVQVTRSLPHLRHRQNWAPEAQSLMCACFSVASPLITLRVLALPRPLSTALQDWITIREPAEGCLQPAQRTRPKTQCRARGRASPSKGKPRSSDARGAGDRQHSQVLPPTTPPTHRANPCTGIPLRPSASPRTIPGGRQAALNADAKSGSDWNVRCRPPGSPER